MRGRWQGNCLWAVAMLVLSGGCYAQSATPDQEYQKLIQVDQNIEPLGEHPFGENISTYDGSVSFNVTDVTLRGNGPTISVGRTAQFFEWPSGSDLSPQLPLGNWDLDIPRIETLVASQLGWQTGLGGTTPTIGTTQRCTNFTMPPGITSTSSQGGWVPDEWWFGYNLWVPGEGKQLLMPRSAANSLSPTISGTSFAIVTKKNWMIGCGVTASDGGEGFLAIAPDGTRYTFAHLVYRPWYPIVGAGAITPDGIHVATSKSAAWSATPLVGAPGGIGILNREDAFMYVTQIQDRFGNTLTYNYDPNTGYLSSITASDGREVDVTYVSGSQLIQTISAKASDAPARTWTYTYVSTYASSDLAGVQLPDGSAWSYDLPIGPQAINLSSSNCQLDELPNFTYPVTGGITGTITAPSGLTGTFSFGGKLSGRSYTPKQCYGNLNGTAPSALYPEWYVQSAIVSEALSGAGMPTQTWSYSYSPANQSWDKDACATSGTCVTTVYTDVTDPNGNDTRYTYSNRYDATEGQLLRTDYYSGAAGGTPLRTVVNTYASPTGGPWPAVYGTDLLYRDNQSQAQELSPVQQRTITQDGQTYTWQALAFNAYAQPTDVERSNNIAGQASIEESTTYLNDTDLWVLGLPQTVTNVGTGEVETSNTYDSLDELTTRARFGQTLMTYAWNGAGQLENFTDGNNHTTTLGSYKRGIPQAIGYPDGTSESLAVDDFGQIASITDQAGNTTSYAYDPVGRLTQISYPGGDSVAWAPKTFAYSYVTAAERGVDAGHWRRTTTRGNDVAITYFDAELRPVLSDTYDGSNGSSHSNVRTDYDWKGQTTFASYPVGGTPDLSGITAGTSTTYDALGRTIQTQSSSELGTLTSSTAYLPGPGQQVTDPRGEVTTTYYQVFDEPSYDAVIEVLAPTGITQAITRDLYGNPTAIRQYGNGGDVTKTLTYDAYHRLCLTTEPESGSTAMGYDGANNVAWTADGLTDVSGCPSDAANKTTRTYDAMNRMLTLVPPSGTQSTSYGYDALGNLASAISGISTWTASRNTLGLVTTESLALTGQPTRTIGYAYDANASLASVQYPDGAVVGYAPDALGRPTQVGNYASGVSYYPNGEVASFTYGNGALYLADQNARQLISDFTYARATNPDVSESFTYDADANITQVNDLTTNGPRTKAFGYDDLNRLSSATAANLWGSESYTYDPLNNLSSRTTNGQVFTYNYPGNNLLASITSGAGTVDSFAYDNRGNVITKNGVALNFDAKNQLTSLTGGPSYAYDAAGRRVSKTTGSGSTYYFYTSAGQLLYQFDTGAAKATDFIYLGKKLIARDESIQLGAPGSVGFDANPNDGSYTVSWGAVAGATSYLLQESANGGAWSTVFNGSATSTPLSGRDGGSYSYQVQGCIGSTCGAFTASATLGVRPALPTVTVPTGTINGTYTVSWSAPASATGYDVQESLNGGAWTTIASATTATSINRPGTTSGSYTYQVSASNAYGTRGWAASGTVTVDTTYGVVPAAPASLSVPAASNDGSAALSWSAANLAARYVVEQSTDGGTSWSNVYDSSGTSTALSGLADGSYVYQVQACNIYGCSGWTPGNATLVVTHPPGTAPGLRVPGSSANGSYTVSWTGVGGATSYTLQEQVNGGGWTTVQANGATSWGTSGRGNGSYGYQAQACNAGGCGPWSAVASTTVLYPPPAPASLSVPATSTGSIAVSWAASDTATSYTLQQNANGAGWSTVYSGGATGTTVGVGSTGSYSYQVQACNSSGCSGWTGSGAVAVTIPPNSAPALSVPGSSGTGSYTVSWSGVDGASSYTLQEQVNGGGWTTVQANGSTSWDASGKGDGSYGYQVQACNAGGCGPWSGVDTVAVALIPATPTLTVKQTPAASSHIFASLTWTAEPNATTYVVQEENGTTVTQMYSGSDTTWSGGYTGPLRSFRVEACNSSGCSPWTNWD